ncbi:hypothetical protein LNP74_22275 [Klebsiella pneumoniae subsp. pneumoniae]|nr:hypothetical protein [Klebsiella pneumoniae subsp. pneumoniae]
MKIDRQLASQGSRGGALATQNFSTFPPAADHPAAVRHHTPQGLAHAGRRAVCAARGRSAGSVSGIYAVHFAAQTAGAGSGAELAW